MAGLLIVNPRAGSARPNADELATETRRRGIQVHVLASGDDPAAIARAADADVLAMAGGDGSLAQVAEVAIDRRLPFVCVPFGTHNARPFRDGVLFTHTASDRIVYADRSGTTRSSLALPAYAPETLEHADLPGDLARPNFGRGLTVVGDSTVIGGSSPATITAFDLDTGERSASVTITMDVRNAVHGLEVWPFDSPGG